MGARQVRVGFVGKIFNYLTLYSRVIGIKKNTTYYFYNCREGQTLPPPS
jgi:hypothetical protein